ncbi:hypothetical protein G7Y89_g6149 [Cudoniella acicularis]|uniref:Uncharacterized protein n=1 Tax=Cudoniella acicularis TaxID=354080 RepID=A0A8H4RNA8_9HELO|nr:hypothetical protein G7Y89_g6149 [Cudoniella acicularis]
MKLIARIHLAISILFFLTFVPTALENVWGSTRSSRPIISLESYKSFRSTVLGYITFSKKENVALRLSQQHFSSTLHFNEDVAKKSAHHDTRLLNQSLVVPNPPNAFKYLFQRAMDYLSPEGPRPLPRDKSVFYSSGQDKEAAQYAFKKKYYDYHMIFKGFDDQIDAKFLDCEEGQNIRIEILSAAMSQASSGRVWVFMDPNGLKENSTFAMFEWPELVANEKVEMQSLVNPRSGSISISRTPQLPSKTATTLSTAISKAEVLSSQTSAASVALSSTTVEPPEITAPPVFQDSYPGISDDDLDCWKSYAFYTSRSSEIDYDMTSVSVSTITLVLPKSITSWWTTSETWPAPYTTLCDGYPRVTGTATVNSYLATSTAYNVTQYSYVSHPTTTQRYLPSPSCTIEPYGTACSNAFQTMSSMISSISVLSLTTVWPGDDLERISRVLEPPCNSLDSYPTTSTKVTCHIRADQVSMLYWPVTLRGNFCGNGTVSTVNPTQTISGVPNTVQFGDDTLTTSSIYYAITNMQLQTLTGLSRGVSNSPRARHGSPYTVGAPYSLDFGDLATIPATKYWSNYLRSTIYQAKVHSPDLTFPPVGALTLWPICDSIPSSWRVPAFVTLPVTGAEPTDDAVKLAAQIITSSSTPSRTAAPVHSSSVSVTTIVEVDLPSDFPDAKL